MKQDNTANNSHIHKADDRFWKVQNSNRFIIPITPQTKVDVTQNTWQLFNIPETCYRGLKKAGCAEWRRTGLCKHTLSARGRYMKRRLEKYNNYKASILALAKAAGVELPTYGFSVYFYFPIPKRWSQEDRKAMHGQMHHRKPDLDNCEKAIFDSLTFKDEQISQLSGHGKFWIDTKAGPKRTDPIGPGYIEILINQLIYNPFGVEWIDQSKIISLRQTMDYKKRKKEGGTRNYSKTGQHKRNLFKNPDKIR